MEAEVLELIEEIPERETQIQTIFKAITAISMYE